jgi:hypothetical protein
MKQTMFKGSDEPIIRADLPGHFTTPPNEFTLIDEVLVGRISFDSLRQFGTGVFLELVAEIERDALNEILSIRGAVSDVDSAAIWKEKLEYLRSQEAIASDPAQKFALMKQIEEAQVKVRELGG